jgi:hypothetical protein
MEALPASSPPIGASSDEAQRRPMTPSSVHAQQANFLFTIMK